MNMRKARKIAELVKGINWHCKAIDDVKYDFGWLKNEANIKYFKTRLQELKSKLKRLRARLERMK